MTTSGQRYDVILDAPYRQVRVYRRVLRPADRYVLVGSAPAPLLQVALEGPVISRTGSGHFGTFLAKANKKDLLVVQDFLESGKVVPVIDRSYPLAETPEALRYLEQGHARIKVDILLEQSA